MVRLTNPPVQPSLASAGPVYRGQSPGAEEAGRFGDAYGRRNGVRPGYLPDSIPTVSAPPYPTPQPPYPSDQWQPASNTTVSPPPVILGPPQAAALPPPAYVQSRPGHVPPPGYVAPPGYPQ